MNNWRKDLTAKLGGKVEDKCKVRVNHFYHEDENGTRRLNGTLVGVETPEGQVFSNIARVHPNDMGSRRLGRTIALGRVEKRIATHYGLVNNPDPLELEAIHQEILGMNWDVYDSFVNDIKVAGTLDRFCQLMGLLREAGEDFELDLV